MTIRELYELSVKKKNEDATLMTWNGHVLTEPDFQRWNGKKVVVFVPRREEPKSDA